MRVIVTGADGFVGRALLPLLRGHDVVATDRTGSGPGWTAGDLTDAATLDRMFAAPCDAVIHLATIPGGAAEADPDAAWRVNVEGARRVADHAAASGRRPRFVFASSIAVLGDPLPTEGVDDGTPPRPILLYGAHKLLVEEWLLTLGRRGALDPLALRLPGIVARPPGAGTALRSAFLSELFHALAAGRRVTLPVSAGARMWLMSAQTAAQNLAHALTAPIGGRVNLSALHATMAALAAAVAAATGADPTLVDYAPDPALEAQFGAYPPLDASAARAAGFADDGDLATLVANARHTIAREAP